MPPIEFWGGVECTINRVNDRYFSQIKKNGHLDRLEDLERFADLGIKKIRYPFLWEHLAPSGLDKANWHWADQRIRKLDDLHLEPIAGLLHHGSGPTFTSLVDPDFPDLFAEYAFAFASRYPQISLYTPINEPLTTARFSGLYGHWYPHGNDDSTFARAFVNQIKGIVKAMRVIREVNPNAQLVQTEDLGKTHCTRTLQYQANFENERRWLTFDMLAGNITSGKMMWDYLIHTGIKEDELLDLLSTPCPPDIIGINHYLTSERFLDHKVENYPLHLRGGNGRHQYVDVEAVRVGSVARAGFYHLLKDTSKRFKTPVALTEVHLGCTREEQMRWFYEAWKSCEKLNEEGFSIVGLTAWALLGTFDWNLLVTSDNGLYEAGAFDVKGKEPRETALAKLVKKLSNDDFYEHPLLQAPGWWERPERILYHRPKQDTHKILVHNKTEKQVSPLIIVGASGCLGKAFAHFCNVRGIPYRLLGRMDIDIADLDSVNQAVSLYKPWGIINAAGYVHVDKAEIEPERCFRENIHGAVVLAKVCLNNNIRLMSFSSDLVFDGKRKHPYLEDHPKKPLSIYGLSKKEAERQVLKIFPEALMIRSSSFFGHEENKFFIYEALKSAAKQTPFYAASDRKISPTYIPDLVHACLDLFIDGECGIWNLTNHGETTWSELASLAIQMSGLDEKFVVPVESSRFKYQAKRPSYSVLASRRGILLPKLLDSLEKFISGVDVPLLKEKM